MAGLNVSTAIVSTEYNSQLQRRKISSVFRFCNVSAKLLCSSIFFRLSDLQRSYTLGFLFILFVLLDITLTRTASPRTIYAVNCGGPSYFSQKERIYYVADERFSGGLVSDAGKELAPFPRTMDDVVYQTERYANGDLVYRIPLKNDGHFVVVLKFSEVYFQSPNKKVFHVMVGGHTVIENLDIFKEVGKGVPHDEYIEVSRDGKNVLVDGLETKDGWDYEKEELTIKLLQIRGKDNPKINAIVVYEGNIDDIPRLASYIKPVANSIENFELYANKKSEKSMEQIELVETLENDEDIELLIKTPNDIFIKLGLISAYVVGFVGIFIFAKRFFRSGNLVNSNNENCHMKNL